MAHFRWSDNANYARTFSAERSTFIEPAMNALIDARVATCRSYHRGEYKAQYQLCPKLEIHVLVGDQFYRLGRVVDTSAGPKTAWVPRPFFVPMIGKWITPPKRGEWPGAGHWPPAETPSYDDRAFVEANVDEIWECAEDTIRWGGALKRLAKDIKGLF